MASPLRGGRNVIVWRRGHAKALMYMAVLLQLLGAACAQCPPVAGLGSGTGRFRLPEGGEDGIYHGFVDDNRQPQVEYLGKANTTSPAPNVNLRGMGGPGVKPQDDVLYCQGALLDPSDAILATSGLAAYFGFGNGFHGSIFYKVGCVIAYGCDYGNGQWTDSDLIWDDNKYIATSCGDWSWTGWYGHVNWRSRYGRSYANFLVC